MPVNREPRTIERAKLWIEARRKGETAASIARREGVSPSWVSILTCEAGPFPRHPPIATATVQAWVKDRRAGHSIAAIARRVDVDPRVVQRETAAEGHYPHGQQARWPGDPLGVTAISVLLGVSNPTVVRWARNGILPPPDSVTDSGRAQWEADTITQWAAQLPACPSCGARAPSISKHVGAVHNRPPPPREVH